MDASPRHDASAAPLPLAWRNRFATLGPRFFTALPAQGLPDPHWVANSPACAAWLGWPADWQQSLDALAVFSGNAAWPGMQPLASVYSGHQFGVWAGQLGDGRALWLGEVETPDGAVELQLKGAGRTPYSRGADGRAVLRSSVREFLCSEAMAALGIPTTRALCIAGSALPVRRETMETAAVVTRAAPSFIRFGHFEHFSYAGDHDALRRLADAVIDDHYPECRGGEAPYAALLEAVSRRTASLMADWMAVGFCHGVMNTDNMSVLGLTLDYGPFGFMDHFDPGHICNHSDREGRYAYGRQPGVALWNLHALAQAMLPLVGEVETAKAALAAFTTVFPAAMSARMRSKLGLAREEPGDEELVDGLLGLMARERADFTLTFRRLCDWRPGDDPLRDHFLDRAAYDAWAARYGDRLQREERNADARRVAMRAANPRFVLRNHLAETAIRAAQAGDFSETARLASVLSRPFDEQPEHAAYAEAPPEWALHIEVSCSS